jgi:hypothetical protein
MTSTRSPGAGWSGPQEQGQTRLLLGSSLSGNNCMADKANGFFYVSVCHQKYHEKPQVAPTRWPKVKLCQRIILVYAGFELM